MKLMQVMVQGTGRFGRDSFGFIRRGSKVLTPLLGLAVLAAPWQAAPARADILFEDVSVAAGFSYTGESYGASWGNYNNDRWLDLWVSNHTEPPSLYVNQGDGTFLDVAPGVFVGDEEADQHAAQWGDFDNDGDGDVLQGVGGGTGLDLRPNQLLVNQDGMLVDEAAALGIDDPLSRTRSPLWLDHDRDGNLDAIMSSFLGAGGTNQTHLFSQRDGVFVDETVLTGFITDDAARYAQITGLNPTDPPMILVYSGLYPQRAYRYDIQPFVDVRSFVGLETGTGPTQDVVIADLNGDLKQDLFITRRSDISVQTVESSTQFKTYLIVKSKQEGTSWSTAGDVTFDLSPDFNVPLNKIFIGGAGTNPASHNFTLTANDPSVFGVLAHTPGVDFGLYIGRDPNTMAWFFLLSHPTSASLNIQIDSTDTISNVTPINFTPSDGDFEDVVLLREAAGFVDATVGAGLPATSACETAGAGDFDNDKDVDIYLVCTGWTNNFPNLLFENQGDATFVAVPQAGGAEGALVGRSDTVSVADYDLDGRLDLFVTNGLDFGNFSAGPDQLFRNVSDDGNHWLQIDLEGVLTNRDGIGARLFLVSGGTGQVREQSGGVHRYSQDQQRVHFGLGTSTNVNALFVQWPSGRQQQITNLPADQVIQVVEETGSNFVGAPTYTPGVDRGVFLWRDPGTGAFSVRASGDGDPSNFVVRLIAEQSITVLGGVGIGGDDAVVGAPNGFELTANVAADEAGLDFMMPPGTTALISVERDGVRDPRDLHLGATGLPREPGGWVLPLATLPSPPAFQAGVDLGLFIGLDAQGDTIEARWSGDGFQHDASLTVFSDRPLQGVSPVDLEGNGMITNTSFSVTAEETVTADSDGLDVTVLPGTMLGLIYEQDSLFQSQRVNPDSLELGLPNAYVISIQ